MNTVLSDPVLASPDERIAALLLQRGKLKEADVARARRLQEEAGGGLLALLARQGLVSERDHAEACAAAEAPLLRAAAAVRFRIAGSNGVLQKQGRLAPALCWC